MLLRDIWGLFNLGQFDPVDRDPIKRHKLYKIFYTLLATLQITNLTRNAFGRLNVVSHLGLSNNLINNISRDAFENLRQLITLDLSFNNLTYIEPGAFTSKTM